MIYLQLYKLKQFAQLPQISSLKFTIVHTIDEGHNTSKFKSVQLPHKTCMVFKKIKRKTEGWVELRGH